MGLNLYKKHLVILPEDQADSEIATGFVLGLKEGKNVKVQNFYGGWRKVVDAFCESESKLLDLYPERHVVLLIDFDEDDARFETISACVKPEHSSRVFVIGPWKEPQDLKREVGTSFELIGQILEKECRMGTLHLWNHRQLIHNAKEVERLSMTIRDLLF